MIRFPTLWVSALALAGLAATAGAVDAPLAVLRHQQGDDPRWAARDWDDRDWAPGNVVPMHTGIYWVRVHFQCLNMKRLQLLPDGPAKIPTGFDVEDWVDSVFMAAPFSYEIYWDGSLLGGSGVVGTTRETELVGPLDKLHIIPEELRGPGEHVVAIRLSSFHYNFPADDTIIAFLPCNSAGHYLGEARHLLLPMSCLGGALVVALVSALLYWRVGRWRPLLLCSLVSFALALFYFLIARRWLNYDPYDWLYPRLLAITAVMTVVAGLFPWLLLEQFSVPARRWWLAGLVPLLGGAWLLTSPIYEFKTLWLCRVMLAVSLGITGWAVWRRRAGARVIFCGVLVALLLVRADRREFLDSTFFLIFGGLVLFVFASLGNQLRADRRRAQAATLTASRLETELLKKNIQPHFLMNTLTTVTEVIEQDPKTAVTLIEALAGEFRILAGAAGEKLIPLEQELELCRAHLHIMSLRRGINCSLEVHDADETSPVPPALFHTLVEGGVTHQPPRDGELRFVLAAVYQPGLARYTLTVHGGNPPANGPVREGTGLRYVKARLEESFAGRWALVAGPVAEGWRTMIEIRHPPGESGAT